MYIRFQTCTERAERIEELRQAGGSTKVSTLLVLICFLNISASRTMVASDALSVTNPVKIAVTVPVKTFDSVYVRDTVRKFTPALISPRTSLLRRAVETSPASTAIPHVRKIVIEHYQLELTDPHYVSADVAVVSLGADGSEKQIQTLSIDEVRQTYSHPTLGFVFFDSNSSDIPKRYQLISQREARNFNPADLRDQSDLDVHHNILSIIAQRLTDHSNATLTLTGCNSNVGSEHGNDSLSRARATTIKHYLATVWGIEPSRISIHVRNLPELPSSSKTTDGQAENRRVEFSSADPTITDVFTALDTTRISTPSIIRFKTNYQTGSALQSWTLALKQNGIPSKQFASAGAPPQHIDWDLTSDEDKLPKLSVPTEVTLTIKNTLGNSTSSVVRIPTSVQTLQQKQRDHLADTTTEQYNLVLFNVATSRLTSTQERFISEIKHRLTSHSQILIDGYTDHTGNAVANAQLALKRAKATRTALGRNDATVAGIGEARILYPNDTPEGRFLCRTVRITLRIPSK